VPFDALEASLRDESVDDIVPPVPAPGEPVTKLALICHNCGTNARDEQLGERPM
jgi:hypothetical protein